MYPSFPFYKFIGHESRNSRSGSALLLTLMVVSLLLVLVLGFVIFVRMELRETSNRQDLIRAQYQARLGLELAVARLQETAGPDTRVTATASVLDQDPDTPAPDGLQHPHWTGVWKKQNPDSRQHDPAFEGWLTSLSSGKADLPSASQGVLDPGMAVKLVGEGSVSRVEDQVWAEKVEMTVPGSSRVSRYAYLVLDEGVKASLGLNDPDVDASGLPGYWSQTLAQRQASETLSGFSAEQNGEPVIRTRAKVMEGLPSRDSVSLVDESFVEGRRRHFHDATLQTLGVASDTAKGGLKTDLSVAFELPDADYHALARFQDSGERNEGLSNGWDQGFDLGYIYALESRSGSNTAPQNESNPAEADWTTSNFKVRGPTWEQLRKHYRLYQERNALGASEGLIARAPGPDRFDGVSREESPVLSYISTKKADYRNRNSYSDLYVFGSVNQSGNVMRITESALAPVVTRVMYVFSLARHNDNLALIMNNIVVLHNPYDVPVEFRGFKFSPSGLPINRIQIRRRSDPPSTLPDLDKDIDNVNDWLRVLNGQSNPWTYVNYILTGDGSDTPSERMVMQPGEVIAFSNTDDPLLYASQTVGKVGLASGPEYEVDSGLYFNRFGESAAGSGGNKVESIVMEDDSRVWVEIELSGGWGNYLFLTPDQLDASSDSWERRHSSDALIGRLDIPIGELPGGGRTVGSLTGDFYTGAELGTSLQDRVPLFVMDAQLKPLTGNAAVMTSSNPRAMISQPRFLNGGMDHWEGLLYEITSFNDIDLDLDISSGRNNAYWGASLSAASGETHLPLFQVPTGPMTSLADFAHMEAGNFAHDPAYAFGNAFAHPMIDREKLAAYRGSGAGSYTVVDQSFLSNEALWDSTFFSTLSPRPDLNWDLQRSAEEFRDGNLSLPNRNVRFTPASGYDLQTVTELLDPERIAAHVLQQGIFNVNSTSVAAWTTVLSALRDREITMDDGSRASVNGSFFSRLHMPLAGPDDLYNGYRDLSDAEIGDLAAAMVREVKIRGPFLSLADFVNRRLADDDTGRTGALQAAINRAGLNRDFPSQSPADGSFPEPDNQADLSAAGAAGYLMQSDVLRLTGPRLTPRSDTFVVRAYGETLASASSDSGPRVWCEAVVQRIPEPVQPVDPPENGTAPGNYVPQHPDHFGRRFKIVSFRYLQPEEI